MSLKLHLSHLITKKHTNPKTPHEKTNKTHNSGLKFRQNGIFLITLSRNTQILKPHMTKPTKTHNSFQDFYKFKL